MSFFRYSHSPRKLLWSMAPWLNVKSTSFRVLASESLFAIKAGIDPSSSIFSFARFFSVDERHLSFFYGLLPGVISLRSLSYLFQSAITLRRDRTSVQPFAFLQHRLPTSTKQGACIRFKSRTKFQTGRNGLPPSTLREVNSDNRPYGYGSRGGHRVHSSLDMAFTKQELTLSLSHYLVPHSEPVQFHQFSYLADRRHRFVVGWSRFLRYPYQNHGCQWRGRCWRFGVYFP